MKTKNFYKKCLKGYTFFIDNQKTNEPPSHDFQMLVNKLHQLHEILNIDKNSKSKDIQANTLILRKKLIINNKFTYIEKQELLIFPRFIKAFFLEYRTKNTTFKLMLVPEGSIKNNVRIVDYQNRLATKYGNKYPYKPYPIDFLIEDSFYMGETCVSEQLWQDIMGNLDDKDYDKKTESEKVRTKHLEELYRKYLKRYRLDNKYIFEYVEHMNAKYVNEKAKKEKQEKLKKINMSQEEFDEISNEYMIRGELLDDNNEFEDQYSFRKKIKQNIPIGCVSFYDAIIFCNKLSKRFGLKEYYTNIELEFYDPNATYLRRKKEFSKTFNQDTTYIPILRFMPNFESNGFRLPFTLEWWYAFASGFDTYKNKSLKEIGIVELNTNDEFVPLNFKHLKFQDKEKPILDQIWYSKSENIHYLKATKPNSLGIYDMFSTMSECMGEHLYTKLADTPQSPFFLNMLNETRKNLWTLSEYIDFVTKDTIKASKNPYDTPDGTKQSICAAPPTFCLSLDDFFEDIRHSYRFQSFDDTNACKYPSRGLIIHLSHDGHHYQSNTIKDTLRIVKNNPISQIITQSKNIEIHK